MITEVDLIYTIWDTIRAGGHNQDDPINERLMRSYLRSHRGKHLNRAYNGGELLPDEVFQYVGAIPFRLLAADEFISDAPVPKIIRLNNYGIMVNIDGHTISVIGNEEFDNEKKNPRNFNPLMKFINNDLYLSRGKIQRSELENFYDTSLNKLVRKLNDPQLEGNISAIVNAVLVNPDDEPGYDFTSSPYPMPDELIEDMINSVNARDFNLFLRTKSDETGDMRDDAKAQDTSREF